MSSTARKEDSQFVVLRAKALLPRSAQPPAELHAQLVGAEFCAALSRLMAQRMLQGKKTAQAPTTGAKRAAGKNKNASMTRKRERSPSGVGLDAADLVSSAQAALALPFLEDLSAHYGRHAINRAAEKPLGPAIRSRERRDRGTHEGRAWRIWKLQRVRRRWCQRCGVWLERDATTTRLTITAAQRTGPTAAPKAAQRRVCARCLKRESSKCAAYMRATARDAAKDSHPSPRLAAALETRSGPTGDKKRDDTGGIVAGTVEALASSCRVQRPRRRKRRLSAKKQARRDKKRAKRAARVVAGAGVAAPVEERKAVRTQLLKAVPKGPIRRTKAAAKPPSAPGSPLARDPKPVVATSRGGKEGSATGAPPLAAPRGAQAGADARRGVVDGSPCSAPSAVTADGPREARESRPDSAALAAATHSPVAVKATPVSSPTAPQSSLTERKPVVGGPPTAASKRPPPPRAIPSAPPRGPLKKKPASAPAKKDAGKGKAKVMDMMSKLGF